MECDEVCGHYSILLPHEHSHRVYANLTNSDPLGGIPIGFPSPEDKRIIIGKAQVNDVQLGASSTDPSMRAVDFVWTPAWSQEMAAPYRFCFEASAFGFRAVQCYSAIVQKCSYCAEEGDTIQKLAIALDTDWLHLYTLNPVVKNPDYLPRGQLIHLGVQYEVQPPFPHYREAVPHRQP
ncbi:hypothetical protein GUITHDRAFT_144899 [Guillardia theta CCMP2712]|uniref:LysM domain-containing protein n=1 Tax=Guillardia theta (strain CCMP2712) TaxID=905079 RepID=L1IP86_GUITC|nr:hypothetical protein GUITHDRAFT_144899 [Guillardia theta CCMP2712]EKX37630.1 hypothetical protein GUITHDRAFT_144899 [Guillardia theta CCMP2712]|eukprot:XP_005824610.1 hypothetical protein GUITHDRAFT_144899 [Guillardia theta CCMP2712]